MKSGESFYKPSNNTQNDGPENTKQYLVLLPLPDNNLAQSLVKDMNIKTANKNSNTLRQMFNNYKTPSYIDSSALWVTSERVATITDAFISTNMTGEI